MYQNIGANHSMYYGSGYLPLVSMGSKNAASDAVTVMAMNKLIVAVVLYVSNVCKGHNYVDVCIMKQCSAS